MICGGAGIDDGLTQTYSPCRADLDYGLGAETVAIRLEVLRV